MYEGPEGVSYHAGDTAFSESMCPHPGHRGRAISERVPKIDWAMMPIGAYEPVWFMRAQHIGPEDAGRAFEILGAKNFVAMHWGTFVLTDEPLDERRLWVMDVGETRRLQQTAA